ncbi:MAG: hypothetical protein GVY33_12745 [Alphaproteobacteria bacterium]|nr:hypothetical protein [Alphaproteobacteria bacterium]
MLIVNPVIVEPLTREWEAARAEIEQAVARTHEAQAEIRALEEEAGAAFALSGEVDEEADRKAWNRRRALRGEITRAWTTARGRHQGYLERLRRFRVLDPACGSGNFLYLALLQLKDLEHRANLEAEALGLERPAPQVGPEAVKGIEINPYAAELARVTVWIGEIQWMRKNGFAANRNPVLKPLQNIELGDAILVTDGSPRTWPVANAIIGNPPFLGDRLMRRALGDDYVNALRSAFSGRVPGGADLVTYWFDIARHQLESDMAQRAGLVATNSIRGGANRQVLNSIAEHLKIFNAWKDEPWINEGAAVRVSLICFSQSAYSNICKLDNKIVKNIYSNLASGVTDITKSEKLIENKASCFYANVKAGKFDLPGDLARRWLNAVNPNGRPNSDVVQPWANAMDVTRRWSDKWAVDFGVTTPMAEAALYEKPFQYVVENVKPHRDQTKRKKYRENWWLFAEPVPGMRQALSFMERFIATPAVAKHRVFVWLPVTIVPDHQLMVIARDDDTTFGILHSRFHELWSLRMGTSLEDRPRYTPTTTFETFPFPEGLTPNVPAADYADDPRARRIAEVARRLDATRETWLNPPELVRREPEVVPGYPDRLLPVDDAAARELKKRTLTNLYNQRPAWLDQLHRELDEAVAAAYGWPADLADEDILERLLALNLERAARQ